MSGAAATPKKWRLLVLLYLLFLLLNIAKAARLSAAWDPEDSLPVASELVNETNKFYTHKDLSCVRCPAGHFVSKPCNRSGTVGSCDPCPTDTYAKHPNAFKHCFTCRICRSLDQVEIKPCTRTSNTQCACRNGTFCSPGLPCETCHKCKTRCPDGEEMVQPCTSENDVECRKTPATPSVTPATVSKWLSVGLPIFLLIFVMVALFVVFRKSLWCLLKRCAGAGRTNTRTEIYSGETMQWLQRKCDEEQDNLDNLQHEQEQPSNLSRLEYSNATACERERLQTAHLPNAEGPELVATDERKLIPANGADAILTLCESFRIFVDRVPSRNFKGYMRAVGLHDNEISYVETDYKNNVKEQHFQMLTTWLNQEGTKASVNTLLMTLRGEKIKLKGVEEAIRNQLLSEGLYAYEE